MKGQYRIVMEIMLFGIGIAITTFVIMNFNNLQANIETASLKNQMDPIINDVINAIIKASHTENSTIRIEIPTTISQRPYKLFIEDWENLTVIDLKDPTINITRKIFNIDEPNKRIEGEVVSGGGIVEVTYNSTNIIMQRG